MTESRGVAIFVHQKVTAMYNDEEDKPTLCLACGESITYGRRDKKFCCRECKDSYNNRRRLHNLKYKNKVETTLNRNYNILNKVLFMDIHELSLKEIQMLGYNPAYSTSCIKQGSTMDYYCYDICFRMTGERIFNIHRISVNL